MPVLIECPNCQRQLRVQDELIGRRVKCPSCGTAFAAAGVGGAQGASRAPASAPAPPPVFSPPPPPPPPPPEEQVEYTGDDGDAYDRGSYGDDDRRRRFRKKKRRAGERVKIPAIFMLILAILGLIATLITTIMMVVGFGAAAVLMDDPGFEQRLEQQQREREARSPFGPPARPGQNPGRPDPEMIKTAKGIMAGMGIFGVVIGILGVLLQGLMLFGSIQMLRLKTYGLAVTAAILCIVAGLYTTIGVGGLAGAVFPCCCFGGLIFLPINIGVGIWALVVLMAADVKAAFG